MEAPDFEGALRSFADDKCCRRRTSTYARAKPRRVAMRRRDDAVAEADVARVLGVALAEPQEERDAAACRGQRQQTGGGGESDAAVDRTTNRAFPTPLRTGGDKFASLMAAAATENDAA